MQSACRYSKMTQKKSSLSIVVSVIVVAVLSQIGIPLDLHGHRALLATACSLARKLEVQLAKPVRAVAQGLRGRW